jgi:hypothetical protein
MVAAGLGRRCAKVGGGVIYKVLPSATISHHTRDPAGGIRVSSGWDPACKPAEQKRIRAALHTDQASIRPLAVPMSHHHCSLPQPSAGAASETNGSSHGQVNVILRLRSPSATTTATGTGSSPLVGL